MRDRKGNIANKGNPFCFFLMKNERTQRKNKIKAKIHMSVHQIDLLQPIKCCKATSILNISFVSFYKAKPKQIIEYFFRIILRLNLDIDTTQFSHNICINGSVFPKSINGLDDRIVQGIGYNKLKHYQICFLPKNILFFIYFLFLLKMFYDSFISLQFSINKEL